MFAELNFICLLSLNLLKYLVTKHVLNAGLQAECYFIYSNLCFDFMIIASSICNLFFLRHIVLSTNTFLYYLE